MFYMDMLSKNSKEIVQKAASIAAVFGNTMTGTEHILLAIVSENSALSVILRKNGVDYSIVEKEIKNKNDKSINMSPDSCVFTADALQCMNVASAIAKSQKKIKIAPVHIFYAMVKDKSNPAYEIMQKTGANIYRIIIELTANLPDEAKYELCEMILDNETLFPNLFKYGKELTDLSFIDKKDPLIGRSNEIEYIIQILSRRTKNNPCLIGDAGVGKTAIVEGVAEMVVKGNVPECLKNKRIFSLDLTSLISGARYRGDFEQRIKNCIDEAKSDGNIILFIDELHNIVGTGSSEGSLDAANIMKPELARGEIQVIGATTFDEYSRTIEKDSALERRFQPVKVSEPSVEETIEILTGIRECYEEFHKTAVSSNIIRCAVNTSVRYISDRFLPDKAIDVLDEACALSKFKSKNSVDEDDVYSVISRKTGIPAGNIISDNYLRISGLEQNLNNTIIGQESAVKKVTEAVYRSIAGLRDIDRPAASFLFIGPEGVGKTGLAKSIAEFLFGTKESMIKLDMSEYMEKNSVSRLIGAPPGYVGYDDRNNNLCEKVRRSPYSLILFDRIEKAHSEVLNILLQVLDEGVLTDYSMRKVSFRNCIIIMTSNVGAEGILGKNALGFEVDSANNKDEHVISALKNHFTPGFINRINDIIIFRSLTQKSLIRISEAELEKFRLRAREIGVELTFSKSLVKAVASVKDTEKYGVESIRRRVRELIENDLAKKIINAELRKGDSVHIDYDGGYEK